MSTKNQPDPQPSPARPQPAATKDQATRPTEAPKTVQPQRSVQPQVVQRPRSLPVTTSRPAAPASGAANERLFSLDAYRGFVMILLVAMGFGLLNLSQLPESAPVWQYVDYSTWQLRLAQNFDFTIWKSIFDSDFGPLGVSLWDLIQPAFLFIVGVAMPYSNARRAAAGEGVVQRTIHALFRALVLILMGVFLASTASTMTNWTFVEALSQIGLGYFFAYLIMTVCRRFWIQALVFVLILAGYWGWFYSFTPPADYNYAAVGASADEIMEGSFAPWSKNANVAHNVDVLLLNKLPRPALKPFEFSPTGEQTLNFIPAIGTILLGVFCGQLLMSDRRWWQKFLGLVVGGGVCLGLGVVAGMYACPIVKRIWTPSWVLFSGAWVIWGLAVFYLLFDLCRLRWIGWPLVVVGVNSLAFYLMVCLIYPWAVRTMQTHFDALWGWAIDPEWLASDMFGWLVAPVSALVLFWLVGLWLYSKKYFVRVSVDSKMNRRTMLQWLGGAAAACVLPRAVGAEGPRARWKTAVGLNGFMSSGQDHNRIYPIWEILDFARRTGFDGVELVEGWPMGNYPAAAETQRIEALKRMYDGFGLQVFSIQLGVAEAFDPNPDVRKQWVAGFRDRVGFARQVGCDCIGLWPGGPLREQTIDEAIDRLAESFREAAKIAGDAGLLASFEVEPPFVFNTEQHIVRILEKVNSPHLKTMFDPSHFDLMTGSQGKPHEMLQRIGVQNIGYVHLTDCDGTIFDGTSRHFPCGDGHIDIPAALATLKEGGFQGWIMIDEWKIPDPYDACVKGKQAIERAR